MTGGLLCTRDVVPARLAWGAVFLALAQTGCKEAIDYTPVSAAEVHHAVDDVRAGRAPTPMRDGSGQMHDAGPNTPIKAGDRSADREQASHRRYGGDEDAIVHVLRDYIEDCKSHEPCWLDKPDTQWQVGRRKKVPNGVALVVAGLGAGLVAGNVACFGTDVCSDSAKTLIGFTDGLLGVAALVTLFAIVSFVPGD
jgi:hypothetical protein